MYGTLGAQIRHYRRLRDMSQEELAYAAGYKTKASINKIEKNLTAVPHDRLIRIAQALRVPIDNLTGGQNYVPHNQLKTDLEKLYNETTVEDVVKTAYNSTSKPAQTAREYLLNALKVLEKESSENTPFATKFNSLSTANQQVVMSLMDTLLAQQKNAPTGGNMQKTTTSLK